MNILLKSGRLLTEKGSLRESGFNFELIKEYRKTDIFNQNLAKEWDSYYIYNDKYALNIEVRNLSYVSELSVSFVDFKNNVKLNKAYKTANNASTLVMPPHSKIGSIEWELPKFSVEIFNNGYSRKLICSMKKLSQTEDFYCVLDIYETTNGSTVGAIPFAEDKTFFYNQKINCQKVKGYFIIGNHKIEVGEESRAILDFARSVWPKIYAEYGWGALSTTLDGKEIGFNLVEGLGDTKNGALTMFMYDKHAYKLNEVFFLAPDSNNSINKKWKISSNDKQVNLVFTPFIENETVLKGMKYNIKKNQIYGKYSGYIMFDKDKIEFKDLVGFIQSNKNTW